MGIVYIFNFSRELKPLHYILRYGNGISGCGVHIAATHECPLTGSVMPTLKGSPPSACELVSNFHYTMPSRIYLLTSLAIVTFKSHPVALAHVYQKIHHVST